MAHTHISELHEVKTAVGEAQDSMPECADLFAHLEQIVFEPGALNLKQKCLTAVALAILSRSEACIAYHLQHLVQQGGTEQELSEIMEICVYMGGAPILALTHRLLDDFRKLVG